MASHLVKELECLLHAVLVVGVGEDARHGRQELGEVDRTVAVLVPLGHALADLVVGDRGLKQKQKRSGLDFGSQGSLQITTQPKTI